MNYLLASILLILSAILLFVELWGICLIFLILSSTLFIKERIKTIIRQQTEIEGHLRRSIEDRTNRVTEDLLRAVAPAGYNRGIMGLNWEQIRSNIFSAFKESHRELEYTYTEPIKKAIERILNCDNTDNVACAFILDDGTVYGLVSLLGFNFNEGIVRIKNPHSQEIVEINLSEINKLKVYIP